MKREFKTVTVSLTELKELAKAKENDLDEWDLCKLHVHEATGNLEMLFWTSNKNLADLEVAKQLATLEHKKEQLEIEILRLKNYLEPISITGGNDDKANP